LVPIVAGNKLAEASAMPCTAEARIPSGLTKGAIDFVGIGAEGVHRIAHVFSAGIAVVAIDIAAKLRVHADARLTPTR
jgi:hypothetical protein